MGCPICESIRRRKATRVRYSRESRHLSKREFRRARWKFLCDNPEELRRVRWNARWPEYAGGGPAPEFDGYVWGSFSPANRSTTEQPTLLDYPVVA